MSGLLRSAKDWLISLSSAWDQFWFAPTGPQALALIRIFAGAMLFYTHLVWSLDLIAFLGPTSWISQDVISEIHRGSHAWSYLWYIDSPALLWLTHILALAVFAALTVGFCTRITSVLAAIITLSYCHRLTGALFGLDQVNAMLVIYLPLGPSGAVYSVDRWRATRRLQKVADPQPSLGANIAVRLIQLHMCVIYLFGGIGKMRGELWWDGSACWFALANYEYQSLAMTWLVRYPFLIALSTHVTVFWETFYPFLVWPRYTRPIALILAVMVHGGIALFLGMPTFGLAMLIGNMAFLTPETVSAVVRCLCPTKAMLPAVDSPRQSAAAVR